MRNGKVAARPSGFPDCLKAPDGAGEEEEKLMTWPKGSSRCSGPVRPFWSNPVKPGQTWSKRKQGFDRQATAGLRNFVTCQKMT